jgi:hypothetical protein
MPLAYVLNNGKLPWGSRCAETKRRAVAAGVSLATVYAARKLASSRNVDLIERTLLGLLPIGEAVRLLRGVNPIREQAKFVGNVWARLPVEDRQAAAALLLQTLNTKRGNESASVNNGNGAIHT